MNLIFLARLSAVNEETAGYLRSAEEELSRVSQIASQALRFHKQQSSAMATDMVELLDSVLTLIEASLRAIKSRSTWRRRIVLIWFVTPGRFGNCSPTWLEMRRTPCPMEGPAASGAPGHRLAARRIRSASHDFGYRARHVSRGSTADLRTLFHHQRRNRHRAGTVGFRRHRGQAQRQHARAQSPGPGQKRDDVHRNSSAFRSAGPHSRRDGGGGSRTMKTRRNR